MTHLDELALEALATGREELTPEGARAHLEACAECRQLVEYEREVARDASVALRRAMPELDDLDGMIARAMQAAPAAEGSAPTRRSLWIGAAIGGLLATALAVLSLPGAASLGGLTALGRQGLTLARAADSLVESLVPGGWGAVAAAGLVLALLLALPVRFFLGERRGTPGSGLATGALGLALALGVSAPALSAHAYRVEGEWPERSPRVTVDVEEKPTSEALRLATEAAGLGLVARLPEDPPVTLHVRDVPLADVVQALLGDAQVVVIPGARLLTVRPDPAADGEARPEATEATAGPADAEARAADGDDARADGRAETDSPPEESSAATDPAGASDPSAPVLAAPPAPPVAPEPPAPPPAPHGALDDRVTFGADVEIGEGEVVRDVVTMGGDARIRGRAFGDVVTMGGDADVHGEVVGDVITMGGDIRLRESARVHGDVNAMGGRIDVDERARVHGQVRSEGAPAAHRERADDDDESASGLFRWGLWHALLFLLGLVLLGSARERFGVVRGELASRPVRSALGGLFGLLAGGVLCFVLLLTLIGIPGSAVLGTLLFAGVCMGWSVAAFWLGSVLPIGVLKDRPVLQLATGLGALFAVGLVPTIGPIITTAAALAGLGAVIATRFGTKPRKSRPRHVPTGPFRSAAR